jgi:TonB family protein
MGMALLCFLELPHAWAQLAEGGRQLRPLNTKKATSLLLSQAPPEYPALAKVNYIQGRVRAQVVVSAAGSVVEAHVLSGNPLLAAAVLNSVREWRYRPFVLEGSSIPFTTLVDVKFALHIKKMDLSPAQAESDFRRQVKPPEVLARPEKTASSDPPVRLRLLVNEEGRVIDSEILEGIPSLFERARKNIEGWAFRPARWGALSVPWYLEVDVPVDALPPRQARVR